MPLHEEHFETDPTPPEILQDEVTAPAPLPPLPTTVVDPVRIQNVPAKAAGWFTFDLAVGTATRILGEDPRRKRAVICVWDTAGASDGAILGGSQAAAVSDRGFVLGLVGANIAAGNVGPSMIEYTALDEVWASAKTAPCTASVLNEQWAQ